ncbi:MAG: CRISPR system precrRNA processing endoribonuclease RAMP protein Cas6 [Bacillota bacterium]
MSVPINCPREFSCAQYRIVLAAGEQGLLLPPYKGSTLRGSFARVFQRLVCARRGESCRECLLKENCPYHLVFETSPPPETKALSKYTSIPRPFILEPPLEQKTDYASGETLACKLTLVGKTRNLLPYFIVTVEELGRLGMGKGRRPFSVQEIAALGPAGERRTIYRGTEKVVHAEELVIRGQDIWNLPAARPAKNEITLEFLTPTRLTFQGGLAARPDFHILIRNLLRRISSLCYFYHGYEWKEDFAGIIRRAEEVKLNENRTRWLDWERYSSRQDTKMKMGGLVGKASYKGPLADFWPLLKLGELVHVGKGAVFGLGKYVVQARLPGK